MLTIYSVMRDNYLKLRSHILCYWGFFLKSYHLINITVIMLRHSPIPAHPTLLTPLLLYHTFDKIISNIK